MLMITVDGFSVPNEDEKMSDKIIPKEVIQTMYLEKLQQEIEFLGKKAIVTGIRIDDKRINVSLHYLHEEDFV